MHGQPKYAADFKHLDYVNPDAPKGGALKMTKTGSFDSLNHHIITGMTAEGLELTSDKLMQRVWDEPFTLYGLVAESADIAKDRSWVVFHLNKAARFHDGRPMTAEDVKFSYEMYRKYGHPVRRRVYGLVKSVEIKNDREIKFIFGPGYDRESVMILALMPVLPRHYWEKHDFQKTTLTPPLGSGPYKIKSVEPGRKIIYERVKDYWAKDLPVNRGQYNFDTITYAYFRDDDVALQSFKAGDANLRREYDITRWQTAYDFKALDEGKVVKEEVAHQRPEWLRALIFNTRRPLFSDIRVREALSDMLDADWLNKNLYGGEMKRIASAFPNSELAARNEAPPSGTSRERQKKAMRLLKEAGWSYKKQKLIDKNGNPFKFEILLGSAEEEKTALSFARSLGKIGIDARVRTVDSAQFAGRLEDFDYDMVSFRWINSLSPGNEQMNYWGSAAADAKGSRNYAGVRDPAADDLADGIARTIDREGLVRKTRLLDHALMAGHYMIPLFYLGRDLMAHDIRLKRPAIVPAYGTVLEIWWMQE